MSVHSRSTRYADKPGIAMHLQSEAELEEHLRDHIAFLESSADAFDRGLDAEAKRLAVSIRVLLHDTDQSHSLLGQLGRKNRHFLSTAIPIDSRNVSTHSGLAMIAGAGKNSKYVAMLDSVPMSRRIPFDNWWNESIFVDDSGATLSRRALVLAVANKDGGAHVDPELNETYARLTRANSLGWVYATPEEQIPIPLVERASVRQIAHEVLRSLNPQYRKQSSHSADVLFGGAMAFDGVPEEFTRKIGRNEKCPCGSGKKFKKCHGAPTA